MSLELQGFRASGLYIEAAKESLCFHGPYYWVLKDSRALKNKVLGSIGNDLDPAIDSEVMGCLNPKGPCTQIVHTLGPMYLYMAYFKAKVYTIWVHGPLGQGGAPSSFASGQWPMA